MARKRLRNPKPTVHDRCCICGKAYAHTHEVYFGKNSYKSKLWKMQARLCWNHHEGTYGVHGKHGHDLDMELKRRYQKIFEKEYGHEKFMAEFGVNYLDEHT